MEARARMISVLLPVAVLLVHAMLFAGYLVDDAYIAFAYGRSLAEGHGLVFQPGAAPVEGYTSFVWVLAAAVAHLLGLEVTTTLPALGVAFGATVVLHLVRVAQRWDASPWAGLAGGTALALGSGVAFWSIAGLETTAFALAVLVAVVALIEKRQVAFSVATGLAFLVRPEAALLGMIGVVVLGMEKEGGRRRALIAAGLLAAIVLPFIALKLAVFGAVLPNTLAAKPASPDLGIAYAFESLPLWGPLLVVGVAATRSSGGLRARVLVALFGVFAVATVLEGGDWMVAGRLFVPWLPLVALGSDATMRAWLADMRGAPPRRRVLAVFGLALLAGYVAMSLFQSSELRASIPYAVHRHEVRAELAREWQRTGVRSVALVDVGYVAWVAPEIAIVDLGGLTDRYIAHAPGGHVDKRIDAAYLERRAPDRVVLTSSDDGENAARAPEDRFNFGVERRIAAGAWLAEHYELERIVTADATYQLHVYARR